MYTMSISHNDLMTILSVIYILYLIYSVRIQTREVSAEYATNKQVINVTIQVLIVIAFSISIIIRVIKLYY